MPPNEQNKNPTQNIYPEPTAGRLAPPPTQFSQNEFEQRTPTPPRWPKIITLAVVLLLIIGGVIAFFMLRGSGSEKKSSVAATADSTNANNDTYYLPSPTYTGPYVYKNSGSAKTSDAHSVLVTDIHGTKGVFTLRQPVEKNNNPCAGSNKQHRCNDSYKTKAGRTIYPLKATDAGAYVEVAGRTMLVAGISLSSADDRASLAALIDALVPVRSGEVVTYNKVQRTKPAWQILYGLPYQIYQPGHTPHGHPMRFQELTKNNTINGDQPYLTTLYTNNAGALSIDNALTTYKTVFDQLPKSAGFNVATNCMVGVTKFTCAEVKMPDDAGYKLYKATTNNYISYGLLADFGGTLVLVEALGPRGVTQTQLDTAVIESLNAMTPARLIDIPLLSATMTAAL